MHKGILGLNNKKAKSLTRRWVKDLNKQLTKEDKCMKRYYGLYVIGKIDIPKRYQSADEDAKQWSSQSVLAGMQMEQVGENSWGVFHQIKHSFTMSPRICILWNLPR